MKHALLSKTLAEIVTENHETATILQKHGLDFCCKGKRSLETACTEKNLPKESIAAELEHALATADFSIDYSKLGLSELVDYIVDTHHRYVKQQMPQIHSWLEKVSTKHGERHNELYKIFECFAELKAEMEMHMRKEEMILFPRIKQLEEPIQASRNTGMNIYAPISVMEDEHEQAGNLMEKIRLYSSNYIPPTDACTTYQLSFAALQAFESDLHQHVHLENNILFPKAIDAFNTRNSM